MALHERPGATDEWYTPPYVFEALGCEFDLDVAGTGFVDWIPADATLTAESLTQKWEGFVWMNPPFGARNAITPWLAKFFRHNNGIALTPDRTSAPWWQMYARRAEAILFVSPKIKFIDANGNPGKSPAQGTTLFAVGPKGVGALHRAARANLGVLVYPEEGSK